MSNTNKIIKYKLESLVQGLKDEGKSDAEIARIISDRYGKKFPELANISRMSISRYWRLKRDEAIKKEIEEKGEEEVIDRIYAEFRSKMEELVKKMEKRDKELDGFLEDAKKSGDTESLILYLREQRQNIEQIRKNLVSLIQYAERQFRPIMQVNVKKEINIKNLLLNYSKLLCPVCRKRVSKEILDTIEEV